MPLNTSKQPFKALERGLTLLRCRLTVGATGAVSAVDGVQFANGAASGYLGGITRNSAGVYTITWPGLGGYNDLIPLAPVIVDGAVADGRLALLTGRTASARTCQWTFLDGLPASNSQATFQEARKAAADAMAADATAEHTVAHFPRAAVITGVKFVPDDALTADNTDFATLSVYKRTSAGASQTLVASLTTEITGTGDWTAFAAEALTLAGGGATTIAAGSSLTFAITKAAAGVAVPAGTLHIDATETLTDTPAVSDPTNGSVIEFAALVRESSVE
jgi:hypothetical protein